MVMLFQELNPEPPTFLSFAVLLEFSPNPLLNDVLFGFISLQKLMVVSLGKDFV